MQTQDICNSMGYRQGGPRHSDISVMWRGFKEHRARGMLGGSIAGSKDIAGFGVPRG